MHVTPAAAAVLSLAFMVGASGAPPAGRKVVQSHQTGESRTEMIIALRPAGRNLADTPNAWIHTRIAGKCAFFYAEHEHEGYVTRDSENGPRMSVARLDLHSNIAGDRQTKTCTSTDSCGRTEREVNIGCRHSCTYTTLTDPRYVQTNSPEQCMW